jgi:hypothetical protein
MLKQLNGARLLGTIFFTVFATSANADDVKQLTVEKGKSNDSV